METAMWTRRRAGAITTLVLGVSSIAAPHVLRAQNASPASTAVVLGSPVISLSYPATDEEAYQAADRAMSAAGVQYVLENSIRRPDQPAFDYARPPDTRLTLTGLSIGRALGEIARADSEFHWRMSGTVVIARFGTTPTPLDQRLPAFNLTDAPATDLLRAAVSSIDPGGAEGWRVLRPGAAVDAESTLSVHLGACTVRDVLAAAVGSGPARSVRAAYTWTPGGLTLSGMELRDGPATFGKPLAVATTPIAQEPGRVIVNASGPDLSFMLTDYARRTGVLVGVETLSRDLGADRFGGAARVDVTGLSPEDALRRMVAYDSRYQVVQKDGWFLVSPKVGVPKRPTILDIPLPPFVRHTESIDVVTTDLVARLGASYSNPSSSSGNVPPPSPSMPPAERSVLLRQLQAKAGARPVSVDLPRETTGRAVVEAIAASAEANAWILQSLIGRDGRVSYQLRFQFPDNSSVGRSFSIDSGLVSTPPPAVALARLDPDTVVIVLRDISRTTQAAITAELVQVGTKPLLPVIDSGTLSQFRNLPVQAALSRLMAVCDGCSWKKDHDIYRVVSSRLPASSSRDAWLDRKVDEFRHHFANIREAFNEIRHLSGGASSDVPMGVIGSGPTMPEARAFDVSLGKSTIRQVVDAVALAAGSRSWFVTYTNANGTFPELTLTLQNGDGMGAGGTIPIR